MAPRIDSAAQLTSTDPALEGGQGRRDEDAAGLHQQTHQSPALPKDIAGAALARAGFDTAAASAAAAVDSKSAAAGDSCGLLDAPINVAEVAEPDVSNTAAAVPSEEAEAAPAPAGPSRLNPSRPKYESIEWQLHRAFMARHAAAADGPGDVDVAAAAPADAHDAQGGALGAGLDTAAKAVDPEPVTFAPSMNVDVAGASTSSAGPGSSLRPSTAPRPRYEHSSMTWQLHTKFMAQLRDNGGAPPAGAPLPAKASEGDADGARPPADPTESPVRCLQSQSSHPALDPAFISRQTRIDYRVQVDVEGMSR